MSYPGTACIYHLSNLFFQNELMSHLLSFLCNNIGADLSIFYYSIIQEMTLEEFEKIREEKRKALLALKAEERKVEVDKDLQSLQPLSNKKDNDEIFIKLVSFTTFDILVPELY